MGPMTHGTNDMWDQGHVGPMICRTIELIPLYQISPKGFASGDWSGDYSRRQHYIIGKL